MSSLYRRVLQLALSLGVAFAAPNAPAFAQGKGGDPVKITTVDGVELHGMFYQGGKAKAPTVIMLHAIGDSAVGKKLYTSLAEALQPNYSVMLFDFRGHGKSKDINPQDFWKYPENIKGIRGGSPTSKSSTIEQSAFDKANYYPYLVNDIAAVKAYLDRRNDAGDCNTSSTILIGAETGATLGAIWLNSQWHLIRMISNPNNPLLPPQATKDPEGKDVIACIWLSPSSKLGVGTVKLGDVLSVPVRTNGCATVFMHSDKDSTGKTLCDALAKKLKVKDDPKHNFIAAYEVSGTNLKGINLIQKSLKTEQALTEYLTDVTEKRSNEWVKRDFRTTQFMWRIGGTLVPAKLILPTYDPNNLKFEGYYQFMGGR
jgi:hypothetical protein